MLKLSNSHQTQIAAVTDEHIPAELITVILKGLSR